MIEAAKLNVKMTKKVLAVNLLKGLRKRRLGTNQIEKISKDLTEQNVRDEKVVVKLMDIVVKAAEDRAQRVKKEAGVKEAKMSLPPGWQRRRFIYILRGGSGHLEEKV